MSSHPEFAPKNIFFPVFMVGLEENHSPSNKPKLYNPKGKKIGGVPFLFNVVVHFLRANPTVFQNLKKSLIQHFNKLRLHLGWTKVH